jgi:E3 ubiquitin-protein ligase RNF13
MNAQNAGFAAVIVFDYVQDDGLIHMDGSSNAVTIPSVFVTYEGGQDLLSRDGELALILPDSNQVYYFFPNLYTIVIVGAGLVFMCSLYVFYRRYRTARRMDDYTDLDAPSNLAPGAAEAGRLSSQDVRNLPKRPYNVSLDASDACCICLEDYTDGDTLIILPCTHKYHQQCLEPWLESRNRHCPMCKRDASKQCPVAVSTSASVSMSESSPLLVNNGDDDAASGTPAAGYETL